VPANRTHLGQDDRRLGMHRETGLFGDAQRTLADHSRIEFCAGTGDTPSSFDTEK